MRGSLFLLISLQLDITPCIFERNFYDSKPLFRLVISPDRSLHLILSIASQVLGSSAPYVVGHSAIRPILKAKSQG